MKKRLISLLLIVCMAFSMTVVANAEEDELTFSSDHIICVDDHTAITVNAETIVEEIPEYTEWVENDTVTYKWQYYCVDYETLTETYTDIPGGTGATLSEFDFGVSDMSALTISGGDGSKEYFCGLIWLPEIRYYEGFDPNCVFEGVKPHYYCWHCDSIWTDEELTNQVDYGELTIPQSSDHCSITHFTDAPATSNWAHNGIEYCVSYGYMNGTTETTFAPNNTTNRAMLVTILYRYAGMPSVEGIENPFTDLKEDSYYEDAVIWAASENIVTGKTETTFDPTAPITREQSATILYRFINYLYDDTIDDFKPQDIDFPDKDKVSYYAKDAVDFITGMGIINGVAKDGTSYIDPQGETTRAQMATILQRFDNLWYNLVP